MAQEDSNAPTYTRNADGSMTVQYRLANGGSQIERVPAPIMSPTAAIQMAGGQSNDQGIGQG